MSARRTLAQVAHFFHGLNDPVDPGVAVGIEEVAFACEGGASGGAQEEPDVQLVFQLLDAAAHGGASDTQAVGRPGEATLRDDGNEGGHPRIAGGEAGGQRVYAWRERGGGGRREGGGCHESASLFEESGVLNPP